MVAYLKCCDAPSQVPTTEIRYVDTIIIVHDTIRITDTIYKDKIITDTIEIETNGEPIISLPVVQKHFGKENCYDIWISGLEPLKIDSMMIYPKKEVSLQTIYQDKVVYKDKESQKIEFYLGGGFYSISGTFIPKIGISTKIGQKWLISADLGLNKDIYDISVNYKIF